MWVTYRRRDTILGGGSLIHPLVHSQTIKKMASAAASATTCLPFYTRRCRCITTELGSFHHPLNLHNKRSSFCSKSNSNNTTSCKASSSSSSTTSFTTEYELDLYELLGIDDRCCDHSKIKTAYRSLQKQCHPDIAGPAGHHMAIILNEAYAILSDPNTRLAYDKVISLLSSSVQLINPTPNNYSTHHF